MGSRHSKVVFVRDFDHAFIVVRLLSSSDVRSRFETNILSYYSIQIVIIQIKITRHKNTDFVVYYLSSNQCPKRVKAIFYFSKSSLQYSRQYGLNR